MFYCFIPPLPHNGLTGSENTYKKLNNEADYVLNVNLFFFTNYINRVDHYLYKKEIVRKCLALCVCVPLFRLHFLFMDIQV